MLDECTKSIVNMEKQLDHNREQLTHLEGQAVSLGDSYDTNQVKLLEATGAEARKFQENVNYIKEFLDANQNARMTLLDEKTEIEKGKQALQERVIESRKLKKSREMRLKIIQDLGKDLQTLKRPSNKALSIAGDCLDEFQKCALHYNITFSSYEHMNRELAHEEENLLRLRQQYITMIEAERLDHEKHENVILQLVLDLFSLREKLIHFVRERWLEDDLSLASFFEGAPRPGKYRDRRGRRASDNGSKAVSTRDSDSITDTTSRRAVSRHE